MKLKITIDRIENDKAILKTDDNDTITWPKDKLPKNTQEGDIFFFDIKNNIDETLNKKELAKDILNEILDTKDQNK